MNNIIWNSPEVLWALWFVPLFTAAVIYAYYKNSKAYSAFNGCKMPINFLLVLKYVFIILSYILLVFALARPVVDVQKVEKERIGKDTLFVFDVSRSMLAEDLKPNRLQQLVLSIVDGLGSLKGNRLGIMAYAGSSVVLCPLTHDYSFFINTLKTIGPDSVSRGGSMTGDAFRKIEKELLVNKADKKLEIIIITDGDDQDSFPVEAAAGLMQYDIKILAIITGDDAAGSRIPYYDEDGNKSFLIHNGQEVWSVAKTETMRQIIDGLPGSALVQVKEGTLNFASVYSAFTGSSNSRKSVTSSIEQQELFQLFLMLAVVMLVFSFIFTVNWRKA